jgi:hypothetical protein
MRNTTTRSRHVAAVAGALALLHAASCVADQAYIEVDGGYRVGDFGTPSTASLGYLNGEVGYITPTYHMSASLPLLDLRVENGSDNTGVGDLVLRAGHVLRADRGDGWQLYGTVAVKLPLADETQGLGTGETDIGGFATLSYRLGVATLYGMLGYTFVGDPAGVNFDNSLSYGVGASRLLGRTLVYASLEGRGAIAPGASDPLEIYAGLYHPLNLHNTLKLSGLLGLSDGSPDWGLEAGWAHWF